MWDGRKGVTIVAPTEAQGGLEAAVAAAGFRLRQSLTLEQADAGISGTNGIVLLDLPEERPAASRLIGALNESSTDGHVTLLIRTPRFELDLVVAQVDPAMVTILCEPSEEELVVGLMDAAQGLEVPRSLHDSGSQKRREARSVRDLQAEVERVAAVLARLATDAGSDSVQSDALLDRIDALALASEIHAVLRVRRLRGELFPVVMFADPAWDIMLDLLESRLVSKQVAVSSLCMAASVPTTTALRWIKVLTQKGVLVRRPDPTDKRRIYVDLSDEAASAMLRWFVTARRYTGLTGV